MYVLLCVRSSGGCITEIISFNSSTTLSGRLQETLILAPPATIPVFFLIVKSLRGLFQIEPTFESHIGLGQWEYSFPFFELKIILKGRHGHSS